MIGEIDGKFIGLNGTGQVGSGSGLGGPDFEFGGCLELQRNSAASEMSRECHGASASGDREDRLLI